MNKTCLKWLIFLCFFCPSSAYADLFSLTLSQNGKTTIKEYTSVLDIFDSYEDGQLGTILEGYNTTDSATGILNFRGIRMELDYAANSVLTFKVPTLGIDQTFGAPGGTQELSFKAFKEYLKANQNNLLTKILKESVSNTPYDSIAGNPSSLMSQMVDSSFVNPVSSAMTAALASQQTGGFFVYFPSGGTHKIKGSDGVERTATTFNMPLGYTFKFDNNWALGIDLPLSYIDMDGSVTYAAQFGANLLIPLYKDKWYLTAGARVGATASEDSLSGGLLYMGTVASNFSFNVGKTTFTVSNMYGRIKDYTLDVEDYNIDYGLDNNVFKNGLQVAHPLTEKTKLSFFFYDTRYTGSDLYIDAYDEVGISISKYFEKKSFFTGLDFTAAYTFGDNYKAYRVGFSLLF